MDAPRHFIFFNIDEEVKLKNLNESYCKNKDEIYKIDIIDNELFFLKASPFKKDLEYKISLNEFNGENNKKLSYKRAVKEGRLIEKFDNFYICTYFSDNECEGLAFDEYERLKLSLVYGLKAKKLGISIILALRIYIFHLNVNKKYNEIKVLLKEFAAVFQDEIVQKLLNQDEYFSTNLVCVILDNNDFYTSELAKQDFSQVFSKVLNKKASKMIKKTQDNDDLVILLEFLEFFKINKKLNFIKELKTSKINKKALEKIKKYTKKYYIG